jgi:hypothetical protein
MYVFSEDPDKLLFEYLPNIYMSNDNADVGEVSCIDIKLWGEADEQQKQPTLFKLC